MTNLSTSLVDSAHKSPEHPAIRLDDLELTYAQLEEAARRLAGLLREDGFSAGDRVGVMLPNVPEFAIIYYGVLMAGGVVVPINPLLKEREVAYYLGDSGAKSIFVWHGFSDAATSGGDSAGATVHTVYPQIFLDELSTVDTVDEVVARQSSDTAVILYTSGTTGKPKGAELTHGSLLHNAEVTASTLLALSPDDVVMGCLPLFHSFGQTCGLNATIGSGATLTLIARFDPLTALTVMARDRVTVFEGVPTMYSALLSVTDRTAYDTTPLRVCASGGAALPLEVLREFEAVFSCELLEGYGLSETSPVVSFNHPGAVRKPGSIGTPIKGVDMCLLDDAGDPVAAGLVGEIAVRGHNVMKGYWGRQDDTAASIKNGWFVTGDMGTVDEDGHYFVVDRKKDLIIRGGFNIYPREVEEVLYEHPAVAEASVIGIPHGTLGEEVGAAVALKVGAEATPEELSEYVKERLAAYKYPRVVWIVDSLPKGPTGKILRREIVAPNSAVTTGSTPSGDRDLT